MALKMWTFLTEEIPILFCRYLYTQEVDLSPPLSPEGRLDSVPHEEGKMGVDRAGRRPLPWATEANIPGDRGYQVPAIGRDKSPRWATAFLPKAHEPSLITTTPPASALGTVGPQEQGETEKPSQVAGDREARSPRRGLPGGTPDGKRVLVGNWPTPGQV